MNPLIVIPARGGSKGVPGKNIKNLNGKPLIQYTVDEARKLFDDQQIIVSTDDGDIKNKIEESGLKVPFLRPEELATDTSGTYEVLLHAIQYYESQGNDAEILVLLQPTSPFRTAIHIEEALKLFSPDIDMVVSVKETKANPYYLLFEEDEKGFLRKSKTGNFIRRQDCPKVWEYNGAIYVINIKSLKAKPVAEFDKILKYEMDEIASHDIDTPLDWKIAEYLIEKH